MGEFSKKCGHEVWAKAAEHAHASDIVAARKVALKNSAFMFWYNYVLEYADAYNIQPATIDNLPAAADTIHTTRRLNFQQIARTTGTPVETIRMMNPQYLQGVTPAGRDNIICLPQGKARFMRKHAAEAAEADETKEETVAQQ